MFICEGVCGETRTCTACTATEDRLKGWGEDFGWEFKKKYKLYQLTRDTVAIKDTDER